MSDSSERINCHKPRLLFVVTLAITLYPPILTLLQKGMAAPFYYFAADAFYYLNIAKSTAGQRFYTFDGLFPTNGFHPLWQYYLATSFESPLLIHDLDRQLLFAFFSSILLVSFGYALYSVTLFYLTNSVVLSLLGSIPGVYYLLFASIHPHYGAPWSFMNGMESPLTIFFFGIALYLLVTKKWLQHFSFPRIMLASFLFSLITLSRLDDIFIFIPLFVFLLRFSDRKKLFQSLLAATLPATLMIGSYLGYNLWYMGIALPVSALEKGGLSLVQNTLYLATTFLPVTQFTPGWAGGWSGSAWRVLQLIAPAFVATLWLVFLIRNRIYQQSPLDDENYTFVGIGFFALYVISKASYNFFNVMLWNQGHWYFPANILFFNLLAVHFLCNLVRAKENYAAIIVSFSFVLLMANNFADVKRISGYNQHYFDFWIQRENITRNLSEKYEGEGIIEFDDGIISFSLPLPAMSGLGFALDVEAVEAKKEGQLLALAYNRGFRIFSSVNYLHLPEEALSDERLLREALQSSFFMTGQELSSWDFAVLYREPNSNVVFIEFKPADPLR